MWVFAFSRKFSWSQRIGILFPAHWDETKYFLNCNFWSLDPLELNEIMHAVFSIVSWMLFLSECCTSPVLILGSVVQKRLEDFQKVLFSDGRIHSLFRNLPFPHTFVLVPPLDSAIFHTSETELQGTMSFLETGKHTHLQRFTKIYRKYAHLVGQSA